MIDIEKLIPVLATVGHASQLHQPHPVIETDGQLRSGLQSEAGSY